MPTAPFIGRRNTRKWTVEALAGISVYAALCVYAASWLPIEMWTREETGRVLGIFGAFGLWRYGWWATHVVRAIIYRQATYPRLAERAAQAWAGGWRPYRLHVLVTIYRERGETLAAVMASIAAELRATGLPATIWIGTKDAADEVAVERCLRHQAADLDIALRIVRQTGSGKRNAIALILAAMARDGLTAQDFVVFMDSDFIWSPGILSACLPLFAVDPALLAVTTDEDASVIGPQWVKSWLDMRFAQRRLAMQSHSLSKRVLTLTGRFSLFRGTHITSPQFIGLVDHDLLDHWLWGRFRFLSGDDKSTWYALLQVGGHMLYVPDAHGTTIEVFDGAPARRMVENLRRWSGNMLRNGSRAIALGPRRMPLFIWWCLIDQRLAMWTMMLGPLCAIGGAIRYGPMVLLAYAVYVAVTRLVAALVLFNFARRVDLNFTWVLYVNQMLNSAVKLYMIWRLPKQRWVNRGNQSSGATGGVIVAGLRDAMAAYLTFISLVCLVLVAFAATHGAMLPSGDLLSVILGRLSLGRP